MTGPACTEPSSTGADSCVLRQSADQQRQAVDRPLRAGAARRILPVVSKGLRDKVASGEMSFDGAHERIVTIEHRATETDGVPGVNFASVSAEQYGFGMLTSEAPGNALAGSCWLEPSSVLPGYC